MSSEQNKVIARRFQEELNVRNWEGCRSLLAPDCRSYQPGAPGALNNDQFEGVGQMFASAFSDLNVTIHEQVAEGDTVVTRMCIVGTHQPPPFPPAPAACIEVAHEPIGQSHGERAPAQRAIH
jgi:hypothetical protein